MPWPQITFDEALYFVVVTFTTVGYGDMLPAGHGSRSLMIAFILLAFCIIPSKAADTPTRAHICEMRL